MPTLPTRFVTIIVAIAGLFRQRTWCHAERLLLRAILATGIRTVAHVLRVLGLAADSPHKSVERPTYTRTTARRSEGTTRSGSPLTVYNFDHRSVQFRGGR